MIFSYDYFFQMISNLQTSSKAVFKSPAWIWLMTIFTAFISNGRLWFEWTATSKVSDNSTGAPDVVAGALFLLEFGAICDCGPFWAELAVGVGAPKHSVLPQIIRKQKLSFNNNYFWKSVLSQYQFFFQNSTQFF